MITIQSIVDLLENPQPAAVNHLSVEVAIAKALTVCTDGEIKIAVERNDQTWLDERDAEYDHRRAALAEHLGADLISQETARKIDAWAQANPYIRPVDTARIAALEGQLTTAKQRVVEAMAWRKRLHDADRFGWDSVKECEDLEYCAMHEQLSNSVSARDSLAAELKLALSGFKILHHNG